MKAFLSLPVLILVVFSASLVAGDLSESSEQSRLEQRIHTYLEALVIQDLQTAYRMETGSRDGSLTAYAYYRQFATAPAIIAKYSLDAVQINGDSATAEVSLSYDYPQLHDLYTKKRSLTWVLIDGDWYFKTPDKSGPSIKLSS